MGREEDVVTGDAHALITYNQCRNRSGVLQALKARVSKFIIKT